MRSSQLHLEPQECRSAATPRCPACVRPTRLDRRAHSYVGPSVTTEAVTPEDDLSPGWWIQQTRPCRRDRRAVRARDSHTRPDAPPGAGQSVGPQGEFGFRPLPQTTRLPGDGRLAARRRVRARRGRRSVRGAPAERRGARPRRVAFVDGTLRTEARLTRTSADGDVSMGLAGSWAAGAVLVEGDESARFDQVTTGARRHLHGLAARPAARPPRRRALGAVRGRRVRRRSGASAAPAPDA